MFEPPRIFSLCHPPHLIPNSNLPWWGGTNELAVPVVSSCHILKTLRVAQVVSPVSGYCSKPASNTLHPQTDHLPLHLALNVFIHFLISSVFLIFSPLSRSCKAQEMERIISEPGIRPHRYFREMASIRVKLGNNSHHLQEQISPDLMEGAQEIGTMEFWVESTQGKEGTGAVSSGTPAQVGDRSLHL